MSFFRIPAFDDDGQSVLLCSFAPWTRSDLPRLVRRRVGFEVQASLQAQRRQPWFVLHATIVGVLGPMFVMVVPALVDTLRTPWGFALCAFAYLAFAVLVTRYSPSMRQIREAAGQQIIRSLRAAGFCAGCGYCLRDVRSDADGLCRCPECGAAWRIAAHEQRTTVSQGWDRCYSKNPIAGVDARGIAVEVIHPWLGKRVPIAWPLVPVEDQRRIGRSMQRVGVLARLACFLAASVQLALSISNVLRLIEADAQISKLMAGLPPGVGTPVPPRILAPAFIASQCLMLAMVAVGFYFASRPGLADSRGTIRAWLACGRCPTCATRIELDAANPDQPTSCPDCGGHWSDAQRTGRTTKPSRSA